MNRWRKNKEPKTEKEYAERLELYFTTCEQIGLLPSVETLALCCGVHRGTLYRWKTGKYRSQEWQRLTMSAIQTIMAAVSIAGDEGKLSPLLTIWREKQLGSVDGLPFEEQALLQGAQALTYQAPERILQKYEHLPELPLKADSETETDVMSAEIIDSVSGDWWEVPDDYDEYLLKPLIE